MQIAVIKAAAANKQARAVAYLVVVDVDVNELVLVPARRNREEKEGCVRVLALGECMSVCV